MINHFTATFDKLNASLLKNIIDFFKRNSK